jgi:signal transduction histidine kinase
VLAAQKAVDLGEEAEPAALVVQQDVTALKEAERLKDEFIAIAAHELRNPLAALKGYAQMLLLQTARGKGPLLADWQQEAIEVIDLSTLRLVDLTGDLLDVTRLQAGGLTLHLEPTDLVALARRIVKRLEVTTEQHSFSITTQLNYLVVPVDPGRLEQVLSNLIGNAIKYSPGGGPIEVTIGEDVQRNEALLSIRDSGIGIPQQEQAHIFARFVRAGNARALGIGGTGLGLYLCRELVELHRGRIWFESSEGKGSTFYITLPSVVDAATLH